MDIMMLCLIGFWVILVVCFIYYSSITKKIIKDQEKEIVSLRTENMRLKNRLGGRR